MVCDRFNFTVKISRLMCKCWFRICIIQILGKREGDCDRLRIFSICINACKLAFSPIHIVFILFLYYFCCFLYICLCPYKYLLHNLYATTNNILLFMHKMNKMRKERKTFLIFANLKCFFNNYFYVFSIRKKKTHIL